MNKLSFLAVAVAFVGTSACVRSTDQAVNSAGAPGSLEVELTQGGLSTGQRGLHHSGMVEFGQPRAEVVAAISAALGRPSATGRNTDCPTGAVDYVSYGPLDLHFENGRFAGWVMDGAANPPIESYQGLRVGLLRSELDGDSEVVVDNDSTLGTELSVDGIGAILSGPGQNARIKTLFAGVTCFAR